VQANVVVRSANETRKSDLPTSLVRPNTASSLAFSAAFAERMATLVMAFSEDYPKNGLIPSVNNFSSTIADFDS
jgi:hypothetical protein